MICKIANMSTSWGESIYNFKHCPEIINKPLTTDISFSIQTDALSLPARWDIIAKHNILLSRQYLAALQQAAPANMNCHFIGLYKNNNLCGIALAQYINLSNINILPGREESFCFKDYLFKKFSSHILIIGNNTITGQNAFLHSEDISRQEALDLLQQSLKKLKRFYQRQHKNIHLIAIKDFTTKELPDIKSSTAFGFYRFSTQPNMIFSARENWQSMDDYLADLNTKYRTQYNRARKKAEGIEKRQLSAEDIRKYNSRIYELYLTVAGNASFNTFHLPENHFEVLKQQLGDGFLFYGYFQDQKLIGFSTIIKNDEVFEAYFLGYEASVQKEKMLYLNMLYDMAAYAIKQKCKHLKFGRSAMEIKSSVGARAEQTYGFIKHTNPLLNLFIKNLFPIIEPKVEWKERSPFK